MAEKKWKYFEKKGRRGYTLGIMECPVCVKTITWLMYNEYLRGIRFCPWCGERLEGYEGEDDEESY